MIDSNLKEGRLTAIRMEKRAKQEKMSHETKKDGLNKKEHRGRCYFEGGEDVMSLLYALVFCYHYCNGSLVRRSRPRPH